MFDPRAIRVIEALRRGAKALDSVRELPQSLSSEQLRDETVAYLTELAEALEVQNA